METKTNNTPKNGVATNVKADDKVTPSEVVVSPKSQELPELKIIGNRTAITVFQRLDEGIKMREQFTKFKEKVDEFEDFARDYNDEGLVMKIENIGTGDKIQLQSVPMILDFIKNVVVKTGRSHLKDMEAEIVQFSL